jgi:hypothetical protein
MKKILFVPLFAALFAAPAFANGPQRNAASLLTPQDDGYRQLVEVQTHRSPAAVIASDALYGGIAGLAVGAGVALLEGSHDWGRDLAVGAGAGLLVGAAFGAVDALSADRVMSAADLNARDRLNDSQRHPAMLGYNLGF